MGLTETLRLVIDGTSTGARKALTELRGEADKTDKTLGTFGSKMNTAANYAAGAATVLTGVIAKSVATLETQGAGIAALKREIDITTEGASILSGEFQRYGIDAAAGGVGIKKLAQSIDEARNGNDTAAATFERLGISVSELQNMSDTEAIMATRDALSEMGAGADRTNIAVQLLGRGALSMSSWYNESVSGMAETNKLLKDSGLVWSDDNLEQYKKAMQAQRELGNAVTGLQLAIARSGVMDGLTTLVNVIGAVTRHMGPLGKALPFVVAGLWGFSGAVKTIRMVQFVTGLGKSEGAAGGLATVLRTRLLPGLRALPGMFARAAVAAGPWILAIAAIGVAVWKTIEAYQEWRAADRQLRQQTAETNENMTSALDRVKAKYGEASEEYRKFAEEMKKIDAQRIADKEAQYTGLASWLDSWAKGSQGAWWLSGPAEWINGMLGSGGAQIADWVGLAEGGTVRARPGGSVVLAAEAGEDEDFVPASKRKAYARAVLGGGTTGGSSTGAVHNHFHFNVGKVVGTDDRAARQLWASLKPVVMSELRLKGAMGRG